MRLPARSLADVIAFNEKHRAKSCRYFGQEIMIKAEEKGPLTEKAYLEALAKCRRLSRAEGIDAVMREAPRWTPSWRLPRGPAWLTDLVNGDHGEGDCSTPPAVAGYPHITVPAGFVHGLPVGISFFGRAWSEPPLLKLAYALRAGHPRRAARRACCPP